jgi:hypothetical protein
MVSTPRPPPTISRSFVGSVLKMVTVAGEPLTTTESLTVLILIVSLSALPLTVSIQRAVLANPTKRGRCR